MKSGEGALTLQLGASEVHGRRMGSRPGADDYDL